MTPNLNNVSSIYSIIIIIDPITTMSVMLEATVTSETVIEPEIPDTSTVVTCLTANVSQPLRRAAVFEIIQLTNITTATIRRDFITNITSTFVVIPATFTGTFMRCINFTILGDFLEEEDELISYRFRARSELDTVVTPMFSILIINRFGKSEFLSEAVQYWSLAMLSIHMYMHNSRKISYTTVNPQIFYCSLIFVGGENKKT